MTPDERALVGAALLTLSQCAARARRAAEADPDQHTRLTACALRYERAVASLSDLPSEEAP